MTFTVSSDNKNPYRHGSFKQLLMTWALEKGEFTFDEFKVSLLELKELHEVKSKMQDDVLAKAWWNEFKNKHKVFTAKQ